MEISNGPTCNVQTQQNRQEALGILRVVHLHLGDVLVDAVDGLGVALDESERDHGHDEEEPDDDVVGHQKPGSRSITRYDEARKQQPGAHENDADSTFQ